MSDNSLVIIAGRNAVREALERSPASIEKVYLQKEIKGLNPIRNVAIRAGVPVKFLPLSGLQRLAGGVIHQGAIAVESAFSYWDYSKLLSNIASDLNMTRELCPRILLLDGIQDPRNFGAIIRSAVAFDVKGIIVSSHHMAPVSTSTIKSSSGAALRIPIARVGRLADIIPELKERGYYVYGASSTGTISMWYINWQCPVVLIIGSEDRGLYPDTERLCDELFSIPMTGDIESLNASVATGIVLAVASKP
ncbi:MAG: 23S rRNA (guanosine(2251)-2'-O)-methyltransferase RlmB [Bacteroidetes bacterium]|nr:23S rRNA (guanosine(2251)-2'-O)-methyltransferase RlmB [Bacteroidota bacterium]